jgi:hypothetical protein
LTVVLGVASLLRPAFADEARKPPDQETIDRLQARFHSGRSARLSTLVGERILVSPVFTPEGVRSATTEPALVPWSEIERIDARSGSPGRGAVVGGVLGLGAGVALGFISALSGETSGGTNEWIGAIGLGTVAGATVGAFLGSGFPGWMKVYPDVPEPGSGWGLRKRK